MNKYITTVIKDKTARNQFVEALHALGYACPGESLQSYKKIGYPRIFIYVDGKLGGNFSDDSTLKTDVSSPEAIKTALEWKNVTSLKLNDEYTAVIDGDEVVVGCQRFPKTKVLELAKLIEGK